VAWLMGNIGSHVDLTSGVSQPQARKKPVSIQFRESWAGTISGGAQNYEDLPRR
jgi:hypothetical protein